MVPVYIEDKKYIVSKSKNILEVCLSLGFNVPYFCWHPALGSIGACRQCAVKLYYSYNSNSQLVMACMTPIVEGMHISLFDKDILKFRKDILELLMINHPHDCPICEEGGQCHLQDMTVMTGHVYRRYRFSKRTYISQYLGPFIKHEMNRCITCYRCVRYYKDYAGGDDFGVFGIHDNIYFGRVQDGALQSEFSGNLVEICPTGVFTDKTQLRNYARKWDITFAPSICQQCSVGCNLILGERYGKLCRVENRYNSKINGYFLCDRGRFGHSYININNRPKKPLKKYNNGHYIQINTIDAITNAVNALKNSHKIIGIGSSRASVESNFALIHLVGSENFYAGIDASEQERLLLIRNILCNSGVYVPSVREIENYDLILILGEDLTQTNARIALSVRQAVRKNFNKTSEKAGIFGWHSAAVMNITQNIKYPLLTTGIDKTKLDDLALLTYYDSVQNQARFGFAIAHALDHTAPFVKDLDCESIKKLNLVVQYLLHSKKPLIISGSSSGSKELIAAAANIAQALKNRNSEVGIVFVVHDGNSMGLSMLTTNSIDDALNLLCDDHDHTLFTSVIVLENDLYRYISSNKVSRMLNNINYLIVLDHQRNLIQEKSDLILPVSNFAESDGTVINYEGRAQRFFKLYDPQYYNKDVDILESWRWLYSIHDAYINYSRTERLNIDHVIDSVIYHFPELGGIKYAAPSSDFRIYGQKLAQSPHRYSGRTAMHANISIHEPCVSQNDETMFTFSMEGNHHVKSEHSQVAFAWSPGWNSPQAWNKFQEQIGENLYPEDPGVCILSTKQKVYEYSSNNHKKDKNYRVSWFEIIPDPFIFSENSNKWLIAPYWHLFGSEYTSQLSEHIKDCMLKPYAMLNVLDARYLNIQNNMFLKFICDDQIVCLPVQFSKNLPVKHIGLPVGFPGIPLSFSGMYAKNVESIIL